MNSLSLKELGLEEKGIITDSGLVWNLKLIKTYYLIKFNSESVLASSVGTS